MRIKELSCFVLLAAAFAVGCTQKPEPVFASSANEESYAERYPAALVAVRTEYATDEGKARELFGGFQNYPAALTSPDGPQVLAVVQRADAAGKSAAYTHQARENQAVEQFFADEKDTLNQKVGGAAQYAAKQKECTVDVASPAIGALDKGVDKALEDRLRGHDEAHRYIEDHQDALGKPNLEKLQKQADEISLASYLVHVRVKELKTELARMVDEASDVKKTLGRDDTEARAVVADPAASKAAKATAQTRATAAEGASAKIDNEVEEAKRAVADMDARTQQLEKDYNAALDALEKALGNLPKK